MAGYEAFARQHLEVAVTVTAVAITAVAGFRAFVGVVVADHRDLVVDYLDRYAGRDLGLVAGPGPAFAGGATGAVAGTINIPTGPDAAMGEGTSGMASRCSGRPVVPCGPCRATTAGGSSTPSPPGGCAPTAR